MQLFSPPLMQGVLRCNPLPRETLYAKKLAGITMKTHSHMQVRATQKEIQIHAFLFSPSALFIVLSLCVTEGEYQCNQKRNQLFQTGDH